MHRTVNQFRPKGDPGAPSYAPQRDLANIYTPMLREVFGGLDEKNWTPFFKAWFDREGITEQHLAMAVTTFMEAHRLFIRDREVDSPADAFTKAGINDLPDTVKYALFCRLGEVITGGFFVAIRDVTMQGQESPCQSDMIEMIASGRELASRISGDLQFHPVSDITRSRADADERQRLVVQLQDMVDTITRDRDRLQTNCKSMGTSLEALNPLTTSIYRIRDAHWPERISLIIKLGWKLFRRQL